MHTPQIFGHILSPVTNMCGMTFPLIFHQTWMDCKLLMQPREGLCFIFDGEWKNFGKIYTYQNGDVQVFQTMNGVSVVFQVISMSNDLSYKLIDEINNKTQMSRCWHCSEPFCCISFFCNNFIFSKSPLFVGKTFIHLEYRPS